MKYNVVHSIAHKCYHESVLSTAARMQALKVNKQKEKLQHEPNLYDSPFPNLQSINFTEIILSHIMNFLLEKESLTIKFIRNKGPLSVS